MRDAAYRAASRAQTHEAGAIISGHMNKALPWEDRVITLVWFQLLLPGSGCIALDEVEYTNSIF